MKQYLVLVSEEGRADLEKVFKGIEFLEVQGLNLNGENQVQMLATPVIPPVNQVRVAPPAPPVPPAPTPDVVPTQEEKPSA